MEDGPPEILRFSLAGVQLKFSAVEEAGGGLTIPARWIGRNSDQANGQSLHYDVGVPENEYSIMSLAGMVGIEMPETRVVRDDPNRGSASGSSRLPRGSRN